MKIKMHRFLPVFILIFVLSACKSDDTPEEVVDPTAENRKGLGQSSEDLLSDDIYPSLTVELAFAPNYKPSDQAINSLRTFLTERLNKPGGINIVQTQIAEQPGNPFTIQEIRDIEDNVRTRYTEGNNIAVYIFFANGSSENDTNTTVTLGTAYRNTSIVVYQRTLLLLTEGNQSVLPDLESTVVNHEFGHILGLTNILGDDIHAEHEDDLQAKHCFVNDCLMYFEAGSITRNAVRSFMDKGEVPGLDPLCIEDLQAKGGK